MKIPFVLMGTIAVMASTPGLAASFQLTSPDMTDGKTIAERHIYSGFGCNGGNQSPTLAWSGAPPGTRSFAITAYDPDAPTGSGWWHWVVFNLPASATGLAADTGNPAKNLLPAGSVQSRTDFGSPGYGGPCPPPGKPHHYVFTVHALDTESLPLDNQASAAMVGFMVNAHSLGHASMTGLYKR